MANDKNFVVTPTLNNGVVEWEMCIDNGGQKEECGKGDGNYPDVTLAKGGGSYHFKVSITNDQTGLGIKFADTDPLLIKKGEPVDPTKKQIDQINGHGTSVLKFRDKNDMPDKNNPAPVVITYGLNFTDKDGHTVTAIDPDITNGGTNIIVPEDGGRFWGGNADYSQMLLPLGLAFIAGIVLTLIVQRFMR